MAQALWFIGPGAVELRSHELAAPGQQEVLARALFSAVSHGTEGLLVRGHAPEAFDPSLDLAGAPVYPRRYGYAWVGEVEAGALGQGTRVFSLATHADAHVLPLQQVRVLPADLPAARATLAASMETALTALWDAEVSLGARVLVLGAGTVGALVAHLCVKAGAHAVCVEPDSARRGRAGALGVSEVHATCDRVGTDFDVVFEVTGDPAALNGALTHCRREGRVVVVSFYGTKTAAVGLGERFHRQRLRLIASQVSHIPASHSSRFDYTRRFEVVLQLLRDSRLDVLVGARTAFCDAPRAYQALLDGTCAPQIIFEYSPPDVRDGDALSLPILPKE